MVFLSKLHTAFNITAMAVGLFILSACSAIGGSSVDGETASERVMFSADRIKADVTFLADDLLRGRDTGSQEYRIAANYVAAEFARLGLQSAGDSGYFQEVPLRKAKVNVDTAAMSIRVGGEEKQLVLGDDFFMSGSVNTPDGDVSADVVFVGYGIHAPEIGHDDLEGLDIEGKIVLAFSGAPTSFNTEIRAHHGSGTTKLKNLIDRGAAGYLSVSTAAGEARRPFSRLKRLLGNQSYDWIEPSGSDGGGGKIKAAATISPSVARQLFDGAPQSFNDVLSEAKDAAPKGFALAASATMKRESILSDRFTSPNVIAVLAGSDPDLSDEYVVLSAHLDHIGVSESAKGDDKINNGALDNATGVSTLLEVARAYVRSGDKPRRSILFAIVTGEEKGLLGAEYFAKYPTVDKKAMVANVNLDMPLLLYDFTDVVAFGAERSSLGPITEAALARLNVSLSPDPIPQEGIFTRSDHYRFVQQGIPAVFLMTGWNKGVNGKDGGKIFQEFLSKTYHSPADDLSQGIDYDAAAKFAHANWLISSAIANGTERPSWNEGDFFGDTFAGK